MSRYTWYLENRSIRLGIKRVVKANMFKTISSIKITRRNALRKGLNVQLYQKSLKEKMTQTGEPHHFYNIRIKQIKYVFQVTFPFLLSIPQPLLDVDGGWVHPPSLCAKYYFSTTPLYVRTYPQTLQEYIQRQRQ